MILEIKPHSTEAKEAKAVELITNMVKHYGMQEQVDYISFSLFICKEIHRMSPHSSTAYLKGDLSPQEIKTIGVTGIDYHYNVFKTNIDWIQEAKQLGLTVNVWTVNDPQTKEELIGKGVDFITTDQPLLLK